MKQQINVNDYAAKITEMLPKGILLNTKDEKFNSMVIGWGHLGTLWSLPTFVVYVRQSRYTKPVLDKTGEFSVSVPLEKIDPAINRVCGALSGYQVDKAAEAGLTLVPGEAIDVPAIREYPLTLECRVLYAQDQDLTAIPGEIRTRFYPEENGTCDFHTMYVGQIVSAYVL